MTVGNGEFKNRYANGMNFNTQVEIYNNKARYYYELFKLKTRKILQ